MPPYNYESPYEKVTRELLDWCESNNLYTSLFVKLELNGKSCTTYAWFECNSEFTFEFDYDWYEGQEDVKLIGVTPINEIEPKYIINKEIK